MQQSIPQDWQLFLQDYLQNASFAQLQAQISAAYASKICYPSYSQLFRALELTPIQEVKVVILGQDPYHTPFHATGLAFSAPSETKIPPSLRNIFKELHMDLGIQRKQTELDDWAKQGVLLLNTSLSVESGKAGSHKKLGWVPFTDYIIQKLSMREEHLIFVLWGKYAQSKLPLINQEKHIIFQSAHPSPLSAYQGFFGSRIFSQINQKLIDFGKKPINW